MQRWSALLCGLALVPASAVLLAQGFSVLRAPARDLSLAEGGGAASGGADRALVNPGALSLTARNFWLEAGDASGVRQQRVGGAEPWGPWGFSAELGLDSLPGLELRDDQGALLGSEDLWAPWGLLSVSHPAWIGSWGLAAGARDRRWLGAGVAPEAGLGWALLGPLSVGADAWLRDDALQAQVSLAWLPAEGPVTLEGGAIAEGRESRWGLGAQWRWTRALALRLGWSRWIQAEQQRVSLGLAWDGPASSFSYGWLPAPGSGSMQKLGVRWSREAAPTLTSSPTLSPSATVTPSMTPTPGMETATPTLTFTPTLKRKAIELDFVLPK